MTPTKAPQKEETKAAPSAQDTQKAVQEGAEKAAKAIDQIFAKLKTHFEPQKVDAWQKKWLAVPENRKKYEKPIDAPEVMIEEVMAMTNDIIDFAQGQEAAQSHVFQKIKASFRNFISHPVQSVQQGVNKAKETAQKAQETAQKAKEVVEEKTQQAKDVTKKAQEKAGSAVGKVKTETKKVQPIAKSKKPTTAKATKKPAKSAKK